MFRASTSSQPVDPPERHLHSQLSRCRWRWQVSPGVGGRTGHRTRGLSSAVSVFRSKIFVPVLSEISLLSKKKTPPPLFCFLSLFRKCVSSTERKRRHACCHTEEAGGWSSGKWDVFAGRRSTMQPLASVYQAFSEANGV